MIIRYVDASARTAAAGSCWMTGMPYSSEAADARRGMHLRWCRSLYLCITIWRSGEASSCELRASSIERGIHMVTD